MSVTEDVIITGEGFIERRIVLFPDAVDLERLRSSAYSRGYKRGWTRGVIMGVLTVAMAALCIWLASA